eukprot:TRINITY_DN5471_c0_g1_i1.p1 TRINITY_DN5471_c0_g1~~TRINITY_DN5471_c0_g1_i1.p1  ORF type:complete len:463 (-),score=69.00 TRINITY_DN5471_c0_g1_i1:165-1553(-)
MAPNARKHLRKDASIFTPYYSPGRILCFSARGGPVPGLDSSDALHSQSDSMAFGYSAQPGFEEVPSEPMFLRCSPPSRTVRSPPGLGEFEQTQYPYMLQHSQRSELLLESWAWPLPDFLDRSASQDWQQSPGLNPMKVPTTFFAPPSTRGHKISTKMHLPGATVRSSRYRKAWPSPLIDTLEQSASPDLWQLPKPSGLDPIELPTPFLVEPVSVKPQKISIEMHLPDARVRSANDRTPWPSLLQDLPEETCNAALQQSPEPKRPEPMELPATWLVPASPTGHGISERTILAGATSLMGGSLGQATHPGPDSSAAQTPASRGSEGEVAAHEYEKTPSQCSTADNSEETQLLLAKGAGPHGKRHTEKPVSAPSTLFKPQIGSPERPSVGSVRHRRGKCKPCAFFRKEGCGSGVACAFCHLCDAGEKKRRKKDLKERYRSRLAGPAKLEHPEDEEGEEERAKLSR